MAPRDDWSMSLLADQGAYRGESYPWDEPPAPSGPTRITVRPAESMYPAAAPDPLLPPPENQAATGVGRMVFPNLSRPETWQPLPPPALPEQATPEGKLPTGDPRVMGGLADLGNFAYNFVNPPSAAAAPVGKAMLLGFGALGANKAAFKVAREMALAGKTPSEIRRATLNDYDQGLFQLADQQWRFPISDKYSRVRPNAPMADFKNPHQLGDFFEHPEWYANVPEMAKMRTQAISPQVVEVLGGLQGGYLPAKPGGKPSILINPAAKTDLREIILHEGTHGNQQRFGFAKGGSPEEVVGGTNAWNIYQDFIKNETTKPLTPAQDAKVRAWASYQSYVRQAGEDEARRMQALRDLSQKELNALPIRKFHEQPFKDQIVTPQDYLPKKMSGLLETEPLRTDPIVRGRSGRPIRTAPLPIGTEEGILAKGYERATGPRPPPGVEQPPFTQARSQAPPTIAQSAVRIGDKTYTGPWHVAAYENAADAIGVPVQSLIDRHGGSGTEGFVTSTGKFVSRKEAMDIAIRARQIDAAVRDAPWPMNEQLTSEHLAMFGLAGTGAMSMGALAAQDRYAQ